MINSREPSVQSGALYERYIQCCGLVVCEYHTDKNERFARGQRNTRHAGNESYQAFDTRRDDPYKSVAIRTNSVCTDLFGYRISKRAVKVTVLTKIADKAPEPLRPTALRALPVSNVELVEMQRIT